MAVKIRLSRVGKKNVPSYRIAVVDERKKRDGSVIEYIGQYNPKATTNGFNVNRDRVNYWIGTGAQTTRVIAQLLKRTAPAATK